MARSNSMPNISRRLECERVKTTENDARPSTSPSSLSSSGSNENGHQFVHPAWNEACMYLSIRKWQYTLQMHNAIGVKISILYFLQMLVGWTAISFTIFSMESSHVSVKIGKLKLIQIKLKFLLTHLIMACQNY